jgi:DNA/RNA-binding domain of Phe-tRNA-synthetase-like protein
MIKVSESWERAYPGAVLGILVMRGARNPDRHEGLQAIKTQTETALRGRYFSQGKQAVKAEPVIAAYNDYYARFKKTYHVALQLESVIWKGRPIPSVSALVEAMFMAELKNMILTAGHDLSAIEPPLELGVAAAGESYVMLSGEERGLKEGDMRIKDAKGVISAVVYGPDRRTKITPETKDALFVVYAPAGVGEGRVRSHLEDIRGFVRIVSPEAVEERLETHVAAVEH